MEERALLQLATGCLDMGRAAPPATSDCYPASQHAPYLCAPDCNASQQRLRQVHLLAGVCKL